MDRVPANLALYARWTSGGNLGYPVNSVNSVEQG